jgi:hypothetical protein
LGEDGGKAGISIDGEPDIVVDTYSADDIWGAGILRKIFPSKSKHTVKVSVLGEPADDLADGTFVYLDGVQITR